MARQKHRTNSWVWFKNESYWSFGKVSAYSTDTAKYTIMVEGDSRRLKQGVPASDVKVYSTGKYRERQQVQFKHPRSGVWCTGTIIRPISPDCKEYFVAVEGDPMHPVTVKKSDIR